MSSNSQRRSILIAGGALVVALLIGYLLMRGTPAMQSETTPGAARSQEAAGAKPRRYLPGATVVRLVPDSGPPVDRIELARPVTQARDGGLPSLAQLAKAALADAKPPSGPVDRRGGSNPRATQELEMLRYAFDTLAEDVQTCLEQWGSLQPGEGGQVVISFEIDRDGLQKSWLEHDAGIPFGPRSCFANAVYGLDWSKIVENPAKMTMPFQLGHGDAGK